MICEDLKKNNSSHNLVLNSSYNISMLDFVNNHHSNRSQVLKNSFYNLDSYLSKENDRLADSVIDLDSNSSRIEGNAPENDLNPIKKFSCGVCYSNDLDESQIYNFKYCDHLFCLACLKEFYEMLINENKISKIKCMMEHCESKISDDDILKILSLKFSEKYLKFSKRIEIINNPNKINCPFPDCEEYAIIISCYHYVLNPPENISATYMTHTNYMSSINLQPTETNSKSNEIIKSNDYLIKSKNFFVSCEAGHKFCSECKCLEWHVGKICTQGNEDFHNYLQTKDHKNCPACGIWVEKMAGCNHIVCSTCNKQWCWLCQEDFKQDHFTNKNSKCFAKMYEGSRFISNIPLDNYEWLYEQTTRRRQNNSINLNNDNLPGEKSVMAEIQSNFLEIYRNYFDIQLKYLTSSFARFLYAFAVLILLIISNYGILKGASSYLDQKFSFYNQTHHSGKKMKYDIINIIVTLSIWIFTFSLGALATFILYIPPLCRYVGGTL